MTIIDINEQFAALRPGGRSDTLFIDIFDAVPDFYTEQTQTTATLKKISEEELSKGFTVVETEEVLTKFDGKVYTNKDAKALGIYYIEFNTVKSELFWIVPPVGIEILNVSSTVTPLETETITYFAAPGVTNVKIQYRFNGAWVDIDTVPNTGSYDWIVAWNGYGASKIKISDASDSSVFDETEINFAITGIKFTTTNSETLLGLIKPTVSQNAKVYYLDDNTSEDFSGSSWSISKTYSDSLAKDILILTEKYEFDEIDFQSQDIESYVKYKNVFNKRLELQNNNLSSLDVTDNTTLRRLYLQDNNLFVIDVTNNTVLNRLEVQNNNLNQLDVTNNTLLLYLSCDNNNLSSLDVTNNTALEFLYCDNNNISTLDVTNNTVLSWLSCYNNNLSELDVTNNTALEQLYCYNNNLSELDVTNNMYLTYLQCYFNNLSELDVTSNTSLISLSCGDNNISNLDITNNTVLKNLYCDNNNISSIIFNGQLLDNLWAYSNDLGVLDFGNTDLQDGCSIRLRDNNMTAAEVDENLVKIATQATAKSRAYDVEIHGTNAAATDGISTGFDGKQAILDIRAEGGTVVESGGF